jgi:hypothetical protein
MLLCVIMSCGIKTKFNHAELKWLNVYKEGDTLIFRSEKGDFDTSIIIKKELFYPEYNPIEVHDRYLPQWGVVWYKNKNLEDHADGYRMITMSKKHPKNKTGLTINFLYSSVIVLDLGKNSIEKYKNGEIYEFDTYHVKAKPYQPRTISWHENLGIVAYITHDSTRWQRIN